MDRIFIELRINPNRADHVELEQLVNALKESGELSRYVRAAIPLYADLEAGRLDVLLYLFPHLRAHFVQDTVLDKLPQDCEVEATRELAAKLAEVAIDGLLPLFAPRFIRHEMELKNGAQ